MTAETEEKELTPEQRTQSAVMTAILEHRARVAKTCGVLSGALAPLMCRKGHPMKEHP